MRTRTGVWMMLLAACLLVGGMVAASAQEATYVGNSACKMCHNNKAEGAQWDVWKASKHAKALETLQGDAAKAIAQKKGMTVSPAEAPECLKCHVTGYDVEKKAAPEKIAMADGVQCETCHGPASLHTKDGMAVRTKKEAAGVDIKAHIHKGDEATCVKCHNAESPTWDPNQYTLENGQKAGFDFKQAYAKIAHPRPPKEEKAAQ